MDILYFTNDIIINLWDLYKHCMNKFVYTNEGKIIFIIVLLIYYRYYILVLHKNKI